MNPNQFNYDPYEDVKADINEVEDFDDFVEKNNTGMDYYAILNVPKDATQEEIKNAYRKLCILYHPDKHSSDNNKIVAQKEFQKINKAYDILGNVKNKIIYDKYGEKGLDKNWDIGPLYKTPEQILEEFERQIKFKRELELEQILKSKGEIKLMFDATGKSQQPVLSPYTQQQPYHHPRYGYGYRPMPPPPPPQISRGLADILHLPKLHNSFILHSWQNDITPKDSLYITGQVFSHKNMNIVSVIGTLSHTISSSLVGEVSTCIGTQPYLQGRVIKNFSNDCFLTTTATMGAIRAPPTFTIVAGRQITPNYTGMITYNTGFYSIGRWGKKITPGDSSSVTLTLIRRKGQTNIQGSVTVGLMESHIRLSYIKNLTKHLRLKTHALFSTMSGSNIGVSVDKKITKLSRCGLGLNCSSTIGFSIQLKYYRLGQTITIPIIISHDLSINVLFWGSLIPLSAAYLIDQYILIPYHKNDLQRKINIIKTANSEVLAQRKKEAEDSIKLMAETIQKKIDIEKKNNGLIIIEALYGNAKLLKFKKLLYKQNKPNKSLSDEIIDVTIPLQSMVNKSQLHLGGYSKSSLIGFYDPCFGKEKVLRVVYSFQGRLHLIEVGENTPLFAPLRDHIINNSYELPEDLTL
ncbi:DnaJ-domain-containing protein [Anaeromyces robustus]|uniref:DnaJ-domain-containing protein n=1 Tax=Anaeromyces robustus TaxID=1754192 RepID=A0A1Y1WR42_9FUNG|nr:DnaJ-domain-containing protein [Anaeromyces robustus]|eukprot:ORX75758.1 DnaJ-domain-containing protein [Anaeromyces robustus]